MLILRVPAGTREQLDTSIILSDSPIARRSDVFSPPPPRSLPVNNSFLRDLRIERAWERARDAILRPLYERVGAAGRS